MTRTIKLNGQQSEAKKAISFNAEDYRYFICFGITSWAGDNRNKDGPFPEKKQFGRKKKNCKKMCHAEEESPLIRGFLPFAQKIILI